MKKFFTIRDNKTKKMYGKTFFENKVDAKLLRDELNGNKSNRYSVMIGPDHFLYKEEND